MISLTILIVDILTLILSKAIVNSRDSSKINENSVHYHDILLFYYKSGGN